MSFIENRLLFALKDNKKEFEPPRLIRSVDEAFELNEKKWGIFLTVNQFEGERRTYDTCSKILAWAVDIDPEENETKDDLMARVLRGPKPTSVVDSGRGLHVYFDADKSATKENYREILPRMIEFYSADTKAKDPARLLRVPGFLHWKDPANPRPVKLLSDYYFTTQKYSEKDMLALFPATEEKKSELKERTALKRALEFQKDSGLFERIYSMDCLDGLERLSGSAAVGGDSFTFKRTASGNYNIVVNGEGTSCWIDNHKRIGSGDGGGPTLWQWVNWYHRSHKKTYQHFKEIFPEVFKK